MDRVHDLLDEPEPPLHRSTVAEVSERQHLLQHGAEVPQLAALEHDPPLEEFVQQIFHRAERRVRQLSLL